MQFWTSIKGHNSKVVWWNLPIYNPKPLLAGINYAKFEENRSKTTRVRERKRMETPGYWPLWPWKLGQGHRNLITPFSCPNDVSVPVWSKSIQWFRRYRADKKLRRRRRRDPHQKKICPPPLRRGDIIIHAIYVSNIDEYISCKNQNHSTEFNWVIAKWNIEIGLLYIH